MAEATGRIAPRVTPRRASAKMSGRNRKGAESKEDLIILLDYNDEFHITIGVVKLWVVRVDPDSWVVNVQHGVRLASALRAVVRG